MTSPERGRGGGEEADIRTWVIDRVEGRVAVLVADDDGSRTEVPLARLPAGVGEGAVLGVPRSDRQPAWEGARVDEGLRQARLDEAESALGRLRRRDPGGDVAL